MGTRVVYGSHRQPPRFDVAARCVPAPQVGGDFCTFREVAPGLFNLTLGDVVGPADEVDLRKFVVSEAMKLASRPQSPRENLERFRMMVAPTLQRAGGRVSLFHG